MKKYISQYFIFLLLPFIFASCSKDDIDTYNDIYNAVRFANDNFDSGVVGYYGYEAKGYDAETQRFLASYSFIDTPFAESATYDLPLTLIGKASTSDRKVEYTVDTSLTNAPTGSYEIMDAVIPADSVKGYIRVKLMNADVLQDSTYVLAITLKGSDQLNLGPKEYLKATLSWNSMIPAPKSTNLIRTYNMLIKSTLSFVSTSASTFSPRALKTIVAALGWNNWDDVSIHGSKANTASMGYYKYLPRYTWIYVDNTYKAYAAKLAEYISTYNTEHPDAPLIHDAGSLKGQAIVARTY
jgi:hypothetical protein